MTKYEYRIQPVTFDPELDLSVDSATLDEMGLEGWDLVTVLGPAKTSSHGDALIYFFRRRLEPAE